MANGYAPSNAHKLTYLLPIYISPYGTYCLSTNTPTLWYLLPIYKHTHPVVLAAFLHCMEISVTYTASDASDARLSFCTSLLAEFRARVFLFQASTRNTHITISQHIIRTLRAFDRRSWCNYVRPPHLGWCASVDNSQDYVRPPDLGIRVHYRQDYVRSTSRHVANSPWCTYS